MRQILTQIKAISPAEVLAWLERGAEAIHELPYRFARWLPTAPGLLLRALRAAGRWIAATETAQEIRSVIGWMEKKAEAIHELPFRFARWLPTAPARWAAFRDAALAWLEKKDITPRLRIFVPLCLAGAILPFCIQPVELSDTTYLLTTGGEPEFIHGFPDTDRVLSGLTIFSGQEGRDAQLVLDEGQTISVRADGETKTIVSRRETVANLLRRLDVECSENEMVVVDISGQTPSISIKTAYTFDWQKNVLTNYKTEYVTDPLMEKGTQQEVQAGEFGNILQTYRNTYRQGKLDSTVLVNEEVTEPVNQVIKQGTKVDEVSRDDRIEKVVYNAGGSGYLLFKSGDTMTFSRKVTCNATAYSIGSWTASGLPTKVGHIAVDPTVFPYGTRFYVYTDDGYLVYGNAVAADCGSGIKGYELDLWFETYDEACWFGRRDCTVFVLD